MKAIVGAAALLLFLSVLAATAAAASDQIDYSLNPRALQDQITNLPGAPANLTFKMFSGYINVDATNGRNLFYWFVESQTSPATAPITLWTNGGPGCSGLIGFFTEQGPFQPTPDSKTLMPNPNAWNLISNMLFIEAPAGVGFSYSNNRNDYNVGDSRTAQDNLQLILGFLALFPALQNNPWVVASESYGGHYVPTLVTAIINSNKAGKNIKIPLSGYLVGNPYVDPVSNSNGQFQTFCGHALASKSSCDAMVQHCITKPDGQCGLWQNEIMNEIGNLDPYGLDFPVCTNSLVEKRRMAELLRPRTAADAKSGNIKYPYDPCAEDYATTYLNRPDVIEAIHADPNLGYSWTSCSNILNYNMSDLNVYMEPLYDQIAKSGLQLKQLIYSGDDDSVCATLGTQTWLQTMSGWSQKQKWTAWTYQSQVGGYVTKFTNGVSFVTVHGAGHMVPQYKPQLGLAVFSNFIYNKWW